MNTASLISSTCGTELKEDEYLEKLEEKQLEVIIRTAECGRNKGRKYIYRSEYQDAVDWEAAIDKAVGNAKAKVREEHLQALYGHSFFEMRRARMKLVYNSLALQYMTAVVVILAFLNDLIEAQIAPPSKLAKLAAGCFDQEGFIARIVSDPYRVRVQARRLFARPSLNPPVWRRRSLDREICFGSRC
jgi:hypothetical protein